jgi:hypothetical protein
MNEAISIFIFNVSVCKFVRKYELSGKQVFIFDG